MEELKKYFKDINAIRIVPVAITYVIWYAVFILLYVFELETLVIILGLGATILGWKSLTKIQPRPNLFIWMPLIGWLIGWVVYVTIKFTASFYAGVLVLAPFKIGKGIAEAMNL